MGGGDDAAAEVRAALARAVSAFGGVRKIARTLLMLWVTGFALFMIPAGIYELHRVEVVSHWERVSLRLDGVELERSSFRKGQFSWRWHFSDPDSGRKFETGDVRPGDLPFSALGWSTLDAEAREWQARKGQTVQVWRAPEGDEIYPEQGTPTTMRIILALCAAYWAWVFVTARRKRRQAAAAG